jgi:hypothetical protein
MTESQLINEIDDLWELMGLVFWLFFDNIQIGSQEVIYKSLCILDLIFNNQLNFQDNNKIILE